MEEQYLNSFIFWEFRLLEISLLTQGLMMIDLSPKLLDKNGKPAVAKSPVKKMNEEGVEVESLEDKVITLGVLLDKVLLREDGQEKTEELTRKRYDLHKRIYQQEMVEVTDEELAYLKTLICEGFEIFFAGQILEILDNQKK